MGARVIQVIEVDFHRGLGVERDPVRTVTQYWSLEGQLLWEVDHGMPFPYPHDERLRRLYISTRVAVLAGDLARAGYVDEGRLLVAAGGAIGDGADLVKRVLEVVEPLLPEGVRKVVDSLPYQEDKR